MRRRRPDKREILPDPVYSKLSIAKFVNYIMNDGKKGVAEKIFYGAMEQVKSKTKTEGLKIFEKAIENASPSVEVKSSELEVLPTKSQLRFPEVGDFTLLPSGLYLLQQIDQGDPWLKSWLSN